jgi:hypothetical protein
MTAHSLLPTVAPNPLKDGEDHINVFSRARTPLGQELSNLAHESLQHPVYGFFASVEALWYWLATGQKHDHLRRLYGATAKTAGTRLPRVDMDKSTFNDIIRDGLRLKIVQNPKLRDSLKRSTLPLRHYYVFGNNPPVVREPKDHAWQMECLEQIRKDLQEGRTIYLTNGTPANTRPLPEILDNPIPEDTPRPTED